MKKLRLYIDASVLGGFFDTEDAKRVSTVETLLRFIRDGVYEGFISQLTVEEVLVLQRIFSIIDNHRQSFLPVR